MKHKILLLFAIAILCPSVLLSAFGIRAIRKERQFRESRLIDQATKVAQQVADELNQFVTRIENEVKNTLDFAAFHEGAMDAKRSMLNSLEEAIPEVNRSFLLDQSGRLFLPGVSDDWLLTSVEAEASFVETRMFEPATTISDALFRKHLQRGEALEFQEKNYAGAIEAYRMAEQIATDMRYKAIAQNSIAGCYAKAGQLAAAAKSYGEILEKYADQRDTNGTAFGVLAQYQLGQLHHRLGKLPQSTETFLTLYEILIENDQILDRQQVGYFKKRVKFSLTALFEKDALSATQRDQFSILSERDVEKQGGWQFYDEFIQSALPILTTRFIRLTGANFYHLAWENTFLSLTMLSNDAKAPASLFFGFQFDWSLLRATLEDKIKSLNEATNLPIALLSNQELPIVVVASLDNQMGQPIKTLPISELGWKVNVYGGDTAAFQRSETLRMWLLGSLIIFSALVILMGFLLTWWAVAKELELAQLKSDFVSSVSHELKTPLASIRLFSEMLETELVPSEEKRHEYYAIITKECERLGRLINKILDFSRMEKGERKFEFQKEDVATILADTVESLQQSIAQDGYSIHTEFEQNLPIVFVDKDAITEATLNLLDNAVKYSPVEKDIHVNLFVRENNLFIEVIDQGVGISKKEQSKIFDRFYRVGDELTRETKGTGLGLALVKYIMESHGGEVLVDSQIGVGSKFSLVLPVRIIQINLPKDLDTDERR